MWSNNGLEVHLGGESVHTSAGYTTLIDMTPGSRGLRSIPLKILPDARTKSVTVVIKLSVENSVTSLGPITTFVYTITNP